jgi:hypothetical protein
MTTVPVEDVFATIAAGATEESRLWAEALRPVERREPERIFSRLLADERFVLGLETIYEGYLLHYGRSRLFAPPDDDVALLLGDYLYAHGLVRIAATGELDAVAALAELISTCAALRADGKGGDGDAWVACARRLAGPSNSPLQGQVERALAAHADRVG